MPPSPHDDHEATRHLNDLGQLASSVGHHVINAFSAIVSQAELLRLIDEAPVAIEPTAMADAIIRTAVDASNVARRLIDFSRAATAIDAEPVALDRLALSVVDSRKAHAPPGVHWQTELERVPLVSASPTQLRMMLDLLVDNACEALEGGAGTVTLATSRDDRGWVALEVRDTGLGMSGPVQIRAVEPFYSTRAGRLGVGLSIARGIWRRHHGTLAIQSMPGRGTTVRLCIEPMPRDSGG